ncbi:MAG: exo-alpha-sialidase, partial [Thermoplasmata archaeon]|nr:exo-alpha-sialidase [Thermoplasmata archaeon]
PHVSYYDKTWKNLKFAVFGEWFVDARTIDSNGDVGMYSSLALDSTGKAHISYYDKTKGNLKWSTGMNFEWITPNIYDEGDTGLYTSIEVDSNDRPRISFAGPSFSGGSNPAIGTDCEREDSCSYVHMVWAESEEIARNAYQRIYYQRSSDKGKIWETPVKSISSAWRHFAGIPNYYMSGPPSISVVGRTVHVVWSHQYPGGSFNMGVFYQRSEDNGDTWLDEEVRIDDAPSGGSGAAFPDSLDIYADEDYVNVVWQGGLRILSVRSAVSEAHTRDGWTYDFGKYSSIAVDLTGRAFITSWDETRGNLIISGSPENGNFGSKMVDRLGNVGQFTSVALSPGNYPYPRIAYYDQANGDLRYASWNGTDWIIKIVDVSDDVGQHASLEMDSQDNAHIAYYDFTSGDLKYAKQNGSSWSVETVDDFGDVGQFASLRLDSIDLPHICYYNATKLALNIASWNGAEWKILEVDTGDVGKYSSLDLDSNDFA